MRRDASHPGGVTKPVALSTPRPGYVAASCLLAVVLLICMWWSPASAYVTGPSHFPGGEATVIVHAFCYDDGVFDIDGQEERRCDLLSQHRWQVRIQDALEQWNNAGANFQFRTRSALPDDDPCDPERGHIYFALTDFDDPHPCTSTSSLSYMPSDNSAWGTYEPRGGAGLIFYNTRAIPGKSDRESKKALQEGAQKTFLHELGHAVGLGHTSHQEHYSIMGKRLARGYYAHLFQDDIAGIRAVYGVRSGAAPLADVGGVPEKKGALENPTPNSAFIGGAYASQSGTGVVSGWVCEADEVLVYVSTAVSWQKSNTTYLDDFSSIPRVAQYGLERQDTRAACGDVANGFSLETDWDLLASGDYPRPSWIPSDAELAQVEHIVRVYADGIAIGKSLVRVPQVQQQAQDPPLELTGTNGPDDLEGGDGDDELRGKKGDDVLRGGKGADELRGGKGADELHGGRGADTLVGGNGADELHGDRGADRLLGGNGDDIYTGGPGADRFVFFSGETGDKVITDFGDGDDRIVLRPAAEPWPSVAAIIASEVEEPEGYFVYTLADGLTVETDIPLEVEDFLVK